MRIDPADLAESIGTLADLNADGGLAQGLDRVVAAATTLFGADTAGLMLLTNDGSLAAVSAFDQQGELAELAQEQLGQGPCMDAFTRGCRWPSPTSPATPAGSAYPSGCCPNKPTLTCAFVVKPHRNRTGDPILTIRAAAHL
jgi:hypothetical protein